MKYFLCIGFILSSFLHAEELLIRAKIIKKNSVYFHLSDEFTKLYVKQPFHLCYPHVVNLEDLPPSIVDIPVICNVIAVIWISGKEYTIEEMDEDLYYSLIKIKEFFKRFFYNTSWEGELRPKRLIQNRIRTTVPRSASLFTGGLDSTTTVFRHLLEKPILLSFNDPHITAVEFAKIHHLDFHTIYMNCDTFLKLTFLDKISCDITKWFWDTSMGLSWVGAATPFLYSMGIHHFYIPSGFTWRSFLFPDGQTLSQPASPLIDENLSPAKLQVVHDEFTMTRTDKLKFISTFCTENSLPKPQLIVCNRHSKSDVAYTPCHTCMKCMLTMLDILAIGENLCDYGFSLSEIEFIPKVQSYIANLKTRKGGTYIACSDTQAYLKKNIDEASQTYRSFYDWFIAQDLTSMLETSSNRAPRKEPFQWSDYQDIYPQAIHFCD